jgi:putative chitinase
MMLTRNDLVAVMPRAASVADQVTPALDAAMARYEIDTPARMAAFLAQLAHESGQLQRWNENLGYRWQRLRQVFPKYFKTDAEAQAFDRQDERIANRVYGGRLGNGPEDSGDGWRYRGRGPIQLTGKDNYRTCGAAIGVDLVSQPERLETPEVGCLAAGWFWSKRGLNALADAGDFVAITKKINGGLIGLEDREAFWERAKAAFGVAAPAMAAARPRRTPMAGKARTPAGKTARGPRKPGTQIRPKRAAPSPSRPKHRGGATRPKAKKIVAKKVVATKRAARSKKRAKATPARAGARRR